MFVFLPSPAEQSGLFPCNTWESRPTFSPHCSSDCSTFCHRVPPIDQEYRSYLLANETGQSLIVSGKVSEDFIANSWGADLMEILRMAAESRKVQLVDLALDLIQKLIAHKHIQGPVYSISHRRDPTGKPRKGRATEDEDDLDSVVTDTSLPQACSCQACPPRGLHACRSTMRLAGSAKT